MEIYKKIFYTTPLKFSCILQEMENISYRLISIYVNHIPQNRIFF